MGLTSSGRGRVKAAAVLWPGFALDLCWIGGDLGLWIRTKCSPLRVPSLSGVDGPATWVKTAVVRSRNPSSEWGTVVGPSCGPASSLRVQTGFVEALNVLFVGGKSFPVDSMTMTRAASSFVHIVSSDKAALWARRSSLLSFF